MTDEPLIFEGNEPLGFTVINHAVLGDPPALLREIVEGYPGDCDLVVIATPRGTGRGLSAKVASLITQEHAPTANEGER